MKFMNGSQESSAFHILAVKVRKADIGGYVGHSSSQENLNKVKKETVKWQLGVDPS